MQGSSAPQLSTPVVGVVGVLEKRRVEGCGWPNYLLALVFCRRELEMGGRMEGLLHRLRLLQGPAGPLPNPCNLWASDWTGGWSLAPMTLRFDRHQTSRSFAV